MTFKKDPNFTILSKKVLLWLLLPVLKILLEKKFQELLYNVPLQVFV
jgi:hypothetical protein